MIELMVVLVVEAAKKAFNTIKDGLEEDIEQTLAKTSDCIDAHDDKLNEIHTKMTEHNP